MKLNRDNIEGIGVSIAVHAVVLLILFFWILKTTVPEEAGGILVNFGNVDAAAGMFEPQRSENVPQPQTTLPPPTPQRATPQQSLITQEDESIALTEKKKKEEERKQQDALNKQREEDRRRADEQRRSQEISNRVAGSLSGLGSGNQSQGDAASGVGNQGSPFGNSDHGANEGVGGYGSFALDGRSIGSGGLPRPAYPKQIEGKIVISITVDTKGKVISAEIGRGTNIDDATMRNAALEAAKKAQFNSITGSNNQTGTITYRYSFK